MKTSRTRLQYLVLLAIPLILVAVYGITQETPKPQLTPKDPAAAGRASNPLRLRSAGGEEVSAGGYGATSDNQGDSASRFGSGYGTAGGFSGTFGGGYGPAAGPPENQRLIQGNNIMISWSKENDELRGFSQKSGEWTNLKIEPQEKLEPVVGTDVAAVRVGDTMAAYSGTTGTWGVLKLSAGSKAEAIVGWHVVQTSDNDYLYTFAAAKGKWTSPNDPKFRPARGLGGGAEFGSMHGTTGIPGGMSPMSEYGAIKLGEGYAESAFGVAGSRTDEQLEEARRIGKSPLGVGGSRMMSGYSKAEQFDQTALNLARQFRGKGLDDPEARAQLSRAVADAFDQRQESQKIEAMRLQEKLKQIQDAIESRETLREKIIQRRVDELLDPNIEWEALSPSSAGSPFGLPEAR